MTLGSSRTGTLCGLPALSASSSAWHSKMHPCVFVSALVDLAFLSHNILEQVHPFSFLMFYRGTYDVGAAHVSLEAWL